MKIPACLLLLVALTASCGGGGSSSIPQADACNQAATAACAKVYSICGFGPELTAAFGTQAQCQTMILASCGSTGFQCATAETYHGDKAEMCKDQFTALDCNTLIQAVLPALSSNNGSLTGAFTSVTTTLPVCGQICTSS